jgi:uncharacterized membrane protein YbhN (UPF0104 family)
MPRPLVSWRPHHIGAVVLLAAGLAAAALVGLAWSIGFGPTLRAIAAYREVARVERGAELEVPKAAALVATGFGVFVHSGGFALDREALQRAGLTEEDAHRRVLGLSALEYAVLAPATLVAAVLVLFWASRVGASLTLPWIIGVPVGALIALTALHYKRSVCGWRWVGAKLGQGLNAIELVLALLRSPRGHGLGFAGTIAYWSGDVFCLWATLHAFSAHTPPLAQLIVGYSTGYAVTRRALPLGGAGVVEARLPFALGWVKIALLPALLAVFAYRLINLWLPMIPALAGLPTLRRLEAAAPSRRELAARG